MYVKAAITSLWLLTATSIGASPTLASAQPLDCWPFEVKHPRPRPNVSPEKLTPTVFYIRIGKPMTRKSEVTLACEVPEPATIVKVVVAPEPPSLPRLDRRGEPPEIISVDDAAPVVTRLKPPSVGPFVAAVPEPQTWTLMLLGFGLAGFALRLRRRSASPETNAQAKQSA